MSFDINAIEAQIKQIHVTNGVDNATVTSEISAAVTAGVAPLEQQITDLQTALSDTITALNANNIPVPPSATTVSGGGSDTVSGS